MDNSVIIECVRDKKFISEADMFKFGSKIANPSITDSQIGAFAMAVTLNGLNFEARVGLTKGMRDSGITLNWDLPGPILDKHSTGGVGDLVSLILAPALVACGAYVPMISGRGLGFTGGTLDKLEAIPGYISEVTNERFQAVVKEVGFAIVGASCSVAPADKRLYRIRDVTGTVNSIDLITASILSKKLSAGLDGLVLDIKTGAGAVIKKFKDSVLLAQSLIDVANGSGCPTRALVTDMSQPLVNSAGNALEIKSLMEFLIRPNTSSRLLQVVLELGSELLTLNKSSQSLEESRRLLNEAITTGRAFECFVKMIFEMGGPIDFETQWENILPKAPAILEVLAKEDGYITKIDTESLGRAILLLGGGRSNENDKIDPSSGISNICEIGTRVDTSYPLAVIHGPNEDISRRVALLVNNSFTISNEKKTTPKLISRIKL